jgi:hypothetical protein
MAGLPREIDPAQLVELLKAEDPTIRTATSPTAPSNSSTPAPLSAAGLSKREPSSAQESQSPVDKYGPVIIGLLVVNAVIGVILLALSVLNWRERRSLTRRPTRSGPHYVSVKSNPAGDQEAQRSRRNEDQLSTTGYSQLSV